MDPLEGGRWSEISTLGTFKNTRGAGAVGSEAEWKQLGKQSTGLGDRLDAWGGWGRQARGHQDSEHLQKEGF